MYKVVKRDGRIVDFDISKISNAIHKAFTNTDTPEIDGVVDLLALRTTAEFAPKIKDDLIAIEDIQDSVESVLSKTGYEDVAKAYILYRKQRERIRNTNNTLLDYKNVVDKYLKVEDWRVKENSTVTYSIGGLILSNSGAITANYWLSEIYDKEIANAHRRCDFHIHDLSMMSAYCAGWSLKQLIQEGLGGIPGKITSAPASHLSTLCNQMVNFLGIMQNEWAGAQAFSSFDTYLAPFVKKDNLTYKQVKQALQSFVFGVNTPSRWGCVDTDTEVLSVNGFKKYDELQEGDLIYTWHDGKLEVNTVNKVIVKPHKGKMHVYKGRGYNQTVTPNHRVLVKKYNKPEYEIKRSEEIFDEKSPLPLPTMFSGSQISGAPLTDKEIELAAIIYTDGSLDFSNGSIHKIKIFKSPNRNGCERIEALLDAVRCEYTKKYHELTEDMYSQVYEYAIYGDSARKLVDLVGQKDRIDSKFMQMNFEQANLFLKTWSQFDGDGRKFMCQYDNDVIRDQLQQLAVLAGKCSHLRFEKLPSGRTTNYVKIRQSEHIFIRQKEELDYDGLVWCPNVENGTAVFRKDNCVFISGQTQAPFSNITLDWTVPPDLKDLPAIVGGKEQDFTYGDCKAEMDMINKAFIEIMIEGDANGRGFQYPIPTYSITREFDWSPTENNKLLFEMTAKYGTPYFSNYINSDMEPSDVRSMCPMVPDTKVVIKNGRGAITVDTIENVFKKYGKNGKTVNVWTGIGWAEGRPVQTPKTEVYDIHFTNGASVKFGKDHLQPLAYGVTLHADQLRPGMFVPFVPNSIRNNRIEEGNPGYVGVAVESIEKCNFSGECLYCFEIDNDDHLFALANGLVTHNCRLRLDLRELRKKSGGYFGSGESTGCYDEKTEILTANKGWIPFKELSMSDQIYTRNPDGIIEIHNPDKIFKYKYSGDMYHFKNGKVDALVTPNHRMVYLDKHSKEQLFVRADEYNYHIHGIPRKAINKNADAEYFVLPKIQHNWIGGDQSSHISKTWDEVPVPMDDWLEFLGWFVSEGATDNENIAQSHGYRVLISQLKDEENIQKIKDLLERLPWNFTRENERGVFIIYNKQLWTYLRKNVKTDCYNARIPREIFERCSSRQLQILIDTMMLGDGSVNEVTGQETYYSASYKLVSNLQELLVLAGYATSGIRAREPRDMKIGERFYPKEKNHITYELTLSRGEMYYLPPERIEVEDYDGYVYCCEVPNHTLLVRRNGKSMWCGNSVGVVTMNMPRIAYQSGDESEFFARLDKLMDLAARSLKIKRDVITKLLDNGLYPYTKRYLGNLDSHFSTIGLVGMNEAGLNAKWIRKDMTHPECQEFTKRVLNHMRERLSDYQEQYGDLYNLEATPAESTAYRFAKHDREDFPDIITAAEAGGEPYYTNSSHLPVGYTDDIFSALDIQDDLQTLYTSGTVFHAFLGEKLPTWEATANLVRKIAENYRLPYYTISPTYSVCKEHGYLNGEQFVCPHCGQPTEVYSRITGYYRPVQHWNDGKVQEYKQRREYVIGTSRLTHVGPKPEHEDAKPVTEQVAEGTAINVNGEAVAVKPGAKLLFSTETCPNCKLACGKMDAAGVVYDKLLVSQNEALTKQFDIMQVPTMVVVTENGCDKFCGAGAILQQIKNWV